MAKLSQLQRGSEMLVTKKVKSKKGKRSLKNTPKVSKRISKRDLLEY